MSIFNSIKNQIGRDIGRSISNVILKDAHAAPIRVTGKSSASKTSRKKLDDYESKIKQIDLTQTPKTIIRKLGAVLIQFDSDIKAFLDDGYIDYGEEIQLATRFFKILDLFSKIEKQFVINGADTSQLIGIYQVHFRDPLLRCVDILQHQEKDQVIIEKYQQLHKEIKSIA